MSAFSLTCQHCGKPFVSAYLQSHGKPRRFCSLSCFGQSHPGEAHPRWKGGRHTAGKTYPTVFCASHPKRKRRIIEEHVLICEKALGHVLPAKAAVHHWNENKRDNRNENLVICQDNAYHMLLHARRRRLTDTGDLSTKRCCQCHEVKALADFPREKRNWDGLCSYCLPCSRVRNKAQRDGLRSGLGL